MSQVFVLVAEDDPSVRAALADELQKHFAVHKTVADGRQLLEAALLGGVDVIVSDLCMPGLSGLDVMHRLMSLGHSVPFVMVSANVAAAHDCITLGAAAFVSKMDLAHELVPAVLSALDGRTYLSRSIHAVCGRPDVSGC
jgi:DNA-binding NarL/FixJ family response regulator